MLLLPPLLLLRLLRLLRGGHNPIKRAIRIQERAHGTCMLLQNIVSAALSSLAGSAAGPRAAAPGPRCCSSARRLRRRLRAGHRRSPGMLPLATACRSRRLSCGWTASTAAMRRPASRRRPLSAPSSGRSRFAGERPRRRCSALAQSLSTWSAVGAVRSRLLPSPSARPTATRSCAATTGSDRAERRPSHPQLRLQQRWRRRRR